MMACIDHGHAGDKDGYSIARYKGGRYGRHRIAYCEANALELSAIQDQLVLHSCDNPRCINPAHLRLGSHADNGHDRAVRRRSPQIVLSPEAVLDIRANCQPSSPSDPRPNPCSFNAFAAKYGVNSSTVRAAYRERSHVIGGR